MKKNIGHPLTSKNLHKFVIYNRVWHMPPAR